MYDRAVEIDEAIAAGHRALDALAEAADSLDSAKRWGIVDILGGGFVTSMVTVSYTHLDVYKRQPDEVDLFMCNDFFLASEIVSAEECGYIPRGEAWRYAIDGRTAYDGDKPINTNGGRTSYGHAFGASGMADVYEAVLQMRGQAGEHQVKKLPKTTMLRGFGGGQNVRISILRTVE